MLEHADKAPSMDEVAEKLRQLVAGKITPEAASNWASPWITKFDKIEPLLPKVKRALVALAGADLIVDMEGHRLHGQEDFEAWLRELLA